MMMILDYQDLMKHSEHTLRFWRRYDEQAGIECVECNEGLVICDNPNWIRQLQEKK